MSSKPVLKLDWASHDAAKFACLNWHYSRKIPSSKLVKIGAWEDGKFIGVVIYSYGANNHIGSPYGLVQQQCVELTRIALKAHQSPVSRILAISLRMLKKEFPGLRLIVSYADAEQGHHGGIYQANGWIYTGKATGDDMYMVNGVKTHPKTVFDRYGTRSIPALRAKGINVETIKSSGKGKYLMPLDDEMRQKLQALSKPYPKRTTRTKEQDAGHHPALDGVTPIRALHIESLA